MADLCILAGVDQKQIPRLIFEGKYRAERARAMPNTGSRTRQPLFCSALSVMSGILTA